MGRVVIRSWGSDKGEWLRCLNRQGHSIRIAITHFFFSGLRAGELSCRMENSGGGYPFITEYVSVLESWF